MDMTLLSVKEFHDAFNLEVGEHPALPTATADTQVQLALEQTAMAMEALGAQLKEVAAVCGANMLLVRLQLCQEELAELARAFVEEDIVECLDALCDMRYVADGVTLCLGLHHAFMPAFREVHASNMSKLDEDGKPIISASGRVEKGPGYWPPRLKQFLGD